MNYQLSDFAADELQEVAKYYLGISRSLAGSFVEEVARCLALLVAHPYMGQSIDERFRHLPLKTYPFFLIYEICHGSVYVISVSHQHRFPERWRNSIQEEPAVYRLAA